MEAKLSQSLKINSSTLNVQNLIAMETYYQGIVGLETLKKNTGQTILGYGKQPILILKEEKAMPFAENTSAGLYHNAIVYASQGHLAATLHRMLSKTPQSFVGSADHLVSEAFYFNDPEGNGLELYFDKDPSTWEWQDGRVTMASLYLDPHRYIKEHISTLGSDEKHMGHIHLKVGNIEQALEFYVAVLGFDITAEFPSALFVSIGGYHHHLGMNTWESAGAGLRKETLGLREFELNLTVKKDIERLKDRLKKNSITFEEDKKSIIVFDPWRNKVIITSS